MVTYALPLNPQVHIDFLLFHVESRCFSYGIEIPSTIVVRSERQINWCAVRCFRNFSFFTAG